MIDSSNELYQRIDETLHNNWDPIGVSGAPQARDEYYEYLPKVQEALSNGASKEDLAQMLNTIATGRMGLNLSEGLVKRTKDAVNTIFEWAKLLKEKQDYLSDKPQ